MSDKDLASIAEARALARRAKLAQAALAEFSQEQIDRIVAAMATAVTPHAEALARLAVEETTFGVVHDKIQKNLFASQRVYEFIRPMKTVGVVNRIDDRKIIEIAEPFGVVAAVIPSTNPTSTAIYKILISIKARCAVVMTPHPSAARCITRSADIMNEAGRRAGHPDGAIGWMNTVTLEGTQELMKAREVSVILATGGMGLVRAAYSAGKPAYGVGPGNAPCYIESSADVRKAANDILTGKSFDNGVLCSSPNSVVVDEAVAAEAKRQFTEQGGYFLTAAEAATLARQLVTPQRLPNPAFVGKSAVHIAQQVGITVPAGTRALIAELNGVGRDFPLSIEKLCPVLSYYVVKDWREGCERCKQILKYGGMGHTMSIHSQNDAVILEFGLHKPAYRICVNTPTTHGSIGLTTGLDPAMTLGCGGFGGNITSDNISPKHLLNIKRVAYELRPATPQAQVPMVRTVPGVSASAAAGRYGETSPKLALSLASEGGPGALVPGATVPGARALPKAPTKPQPEPISADALTSRIDRFLATRGLAPASAPAPQHPAPKEPYARQAPLPVPVPAEPEPFVCEADVQAAIREGRKLLIGERTIVTPSARDAGESAKVFVQAGWPSVNS